MTRDASTRVVGCFAFTSPIDIVCDGDACVVAHSETAMRSYLKLRRSNSGAGPRIKKTRFGEIVAGLQLGGAYAFDEAAYSRFRPLAEGMGVNLAPQDFTGPAPSSTGVRRVRIQVVGPARGEPVSETPASRWWSWRRWFGRSARSTWGARRCRDCGRLVPP